MSKFGSFPGVDGPQPDLACWALQHPQRLPELTLPQWELLIRQARRADVLARIAVQLDGLGLSEAVPAAPRTHLRAAMTLAQAQHREVKREAGLICDALRGLAIPVILLKGAAYVVADLPAAQGRLFSDTDILVPKAALAEVESQLMLNGWGGTHLDSYDQRYYREWMHELPPMEHRRRHTVLDVHHNILPLTVRRPPNSARLIQAARPAPGMAGVRVLAPADMVLHSMAHLFHNDDLSHGLRDLSDLDLLLQQFSALPDFWSELLDRAAELHLQRSLHYGLWALHRLFDLPIPDPVAAVSARHGPAWPTSLWMAALWRRALRTDHASTALPFNRPAHAALYLRAHWLRMPPLMLARHLSIKAWMRLTASPQNAPE